MITTPYAEQESLADQIRNYRGGQVTFPQAMVLADEMIQSMIAGTTADPNTAPPSWIHRLHHWVVQTFLVNPDIAAGAVIIADDPAPPPGFLFYEIELAAGVVDYEIELAAGVVQYEVNLA